MHKKCSSCGLVNWPQDVQCRRCGSGLGEISSSGCSPLRPKLQANDFPFSAAAEDDDAAYEEAKTMIKKGVRAGMICGGISLVLVLLLQAFLPIAGDLLKFAFLDIGIIYGLTLGMHLKSRVCAGLMLGYYILSKLVMLTQGGIGLVGIFVAIAFVKAFYQGLQGTLLYHQIKRAHASHAHI